MSTGDRLTAQRSATAQVQLRPTHGPHREIRVTPEQWHGEACVIGTQCTGDLVFIGYMYDLSATPGSLAYSRAAYAHPGCARPLETWRRPTHSRCQPTTPQDDR
ncbi:hypothetical protein ACIRD3_32250 [Kitasatospora sp. NPDC093550]|uniref:hypothetical protein n=1 Tax=Kitasatospora sp. NPDC093550 TaxID=3364089 RepID=UPI00381814B8